MIIEQQNCIYCGGEGELCKEHVIPVAFLGYRSSDSDKQWIVTACRTCNTLAGSKVFFSIPEKAKYILEQYQRKYKKILNTPFWSDDELKKLDYILRKSVQAGVEMKAILNVRLKHLLEVIEYDIDFLRPLWVETWMKEEKKRQKEITRQIKKNKRKNK